MKLKFNSKNPYINLRKNIKYILKQKNISEFEKIELIHKLYSRLDFINSFEKYLYKTIGMNDKYWLDFKSHRIAMPSSLVHYTSLALDKNPWLVFFSEVEDILSSNNINEMITSLEKSVLWLDRNPYKEGWLKL